MTTSTPHIDCRSFVRRSARSTPSGFTLAEIMVSAGLSGLILAGVLSTFLMIGRTGYAAGNYSEMETQTRHALDVFGADAREALDIRWNDAQSVTLIVPTTGGGAATFTYAYDSVAGSPTFGTFYRLPGDAASTAPREVLAREIAPDLAFQRFKLEQPGVTNNSAVNDLETKQIQLTLRTTRARATAVTVSQSAVSACYILRNKRVTN